MMSAEFGSWLRAQRAARGLTQKALAEQLGIRWQVVQRWETGKNDPSPRYRHVIEQIFPGALPPWPEKPAKFVADPARPVAIYVLIDPRTDLVRYVGLTSADPRKRLNSHMAQANPDYLHTAKSAWLLELRRDGLLPHMRVIDRVGHDAARDAERRWIGHYNDPPGTLTNSAPGGTLGPPHSAANVITSAGDSLLISNPRRADRLCFERAGDAILIETGGTMHPYRWSIPIAQMRAYLDNITP
jgi:transcriptional regulator with XRE-family HTH domain